MTEDALERVERAREAVESASRDFRRTILHAVDAGVSPTAIAKAAGYRNRQRIWQIAEHERRLTS